MAWTFGLQSLHALNFYGHDRRFTCEQQVSDIFVQSFTVFSLLCLFSFILVWHVLKMMFGAANVPNIIDFYFERWATHPLHYGSFSTFPVGADRPTDARERLAANFNRLYFAQDATDQAIGTVSGSVSAGERAAKQIVTCMRNQRNCPRPYRPRNDGLQPSGCQYKRVGLPNSAPIRHSAYSVSIILASLLAIKLLW